MCRPDLNIHRQLVLEAIHQWSLVDLEARTREFFDAMGDVQVSRILGMFADDGRYEVRGVLEPMDKARYERYLRSVHRRMPHVTFTLEEVVVKRNVVFAQWRATGIRE